MRNYTLRLGSGQDLLDSIEECAREKRSASIWAPDLKSIQPPRASARCLMMSFTNVSMKK